MKYLSLFSGIGGFELGIQQAYDNRSNVRNGIENISQNLPDSPKQQDWPTCIGFSEIDKYASQIYSKHFPTHKNYGDITKIEPNTLPDFDLIIGGFPCQSFSIAGKRGGFNDTRGTLFFEIARIIREKQPRLLLLENVKGLLSHDQGRTFYTIISTLDELGYDIQWQVLNSKYFGVPQNRERVFIVGHLRGTPRPEVFPIGENSKQIVKCGVYTGTLTSRYPASQREGTYIEEAGNRAGEIKQINNPKHSNDRVYGADGISPTLNTMQGGNRQPFVAPVITPDRQNKRQNGRRFKENGDTAFTITAQDKHGVYNGVKIRRLTPVECERLQGFPDYWTELGRKNEANDSVYISDSQRYKCLGNAVTVNVIQAIMEKLINQRH